MKRTVKKPSGNHDKQVNSLHNKTPLKHDDPMRHQPPTPQDIQRVQPVSQHQQKDHDLKAGKIKSQDKKEGPV